MICDKTLFSITLLRVIPTLTNDSVVVSDISSGSVCGMCFMTSYSGIFSGILSDAYSDILSGFYFVVFFGILSGILSDIFYLAYIFWHLFWHSIWYAVPAFYLTFYSGTLSGIYSAILSGILAFTLALFLAFYLTFYSGIFWHSLWHGDIGTKICARGWWSGSAHWDLELEVAILHRKEEGEGKTEGRKKEKATLIQSRDPHLAGGEKDSQALQTHASHQLLGQHKKYSKVNCGGVCPGSDTDHSWGIYQTNGEQNGRMEQKCQTKKWKETNEDKGI